MKQLPVKTKSKSNQRMMREWAHEHGKAVLQLTIIQTITKYDEEDHAPASGGPRGREWSGTL